MKTFFGDLQVEKVVGTSQWLTEKTFSWVSKTGFIVIIPGGYLTDGASAPWLFRWLIPRWGAYRRAVVLHDFLYGNHTFLGISRLQCDVFLEEAMRDDETPLWQRLLIYKGVRVGGWSHFKLVFKKKLLICDFHLTAKQLSNLHV